MQSLQWSELARMLERAGRPDEAERAMDRALREARRRDCAMVPEIQRRRAELAAGQGDRATARDHLRSGLHLARRERWYGLELACVIDLFSPLVDDGRIDEAKRELRATLERLPDDVTAPERARAASLLAGIESMT
jgi:hypothetical protein